MNRVRYISPTTIWRLLARNAILFGVVACTIFGMSSCQSVRTGSGYHYEDKYSLKKRKSNISCRLEAGGAAVIKPLPLKVQQQSFDHLFFSIDGLLGAAYRSGESTPDGFDCSGFVQYLYLQEFGMILPRTAGELAAFGALVTGMNVRRGDLVFFSIDGNRIDHVGIMIDSRRFAHAASSGVRLDNLFAPYYQKRYAFGSRLITPY